MCFPNSAYTLIHTNIVNAVPSLNKELLTVDNIANYSGYSKQTGVSISPGRLQRMSRKIIDSLSGMGHLQIDFTLVLSTSPDEGELESRLKKGEVVIAGFSTGVYNKYFEKKGIHRPCVRSYMKLKLEVYPPHYVSLIGIDNDQIAVLDPFCNYISNSKPMPFSDFYNTNSSTITTMDFKEFTSKILFNKNLDGLDRSNRELIYTDVIWKKSIKKSTSKGNGKSLAITSKTSEKEMLSQNSLDNFMGKDEITNEGGENYV